MDKSFNTIKYYGVDYYPEHWPEERWPVDAKLMQEAGFNTVRMAEFAWVKMEPAEGQFDFKWLKKVVELLDDHGVKSVLGTPTAAAPAWLMQAHPEIYRMNEHRQRATFGNRQFMCINSEEFRKASRRITTAMAEAFGDHKGVIGWQIDNEFMNMCYCEVCQCKFQEWLKAKYGSLDAVNDAWGTIFWSHTYTDWVQIPLPWTTSNSIPGTTGAVNPGLYLDYRRFMTDSYRSFQAEQIEILRKYSPDRFITHNYMGFDSDHLDYHKLSEDIDFVTWDNYPQGDSPADMVNRAVNHDYTRGMKQKPFWVMEEQSGPLGWGYIGANPRPGKIREWALQAVEHGAEGIIFFRWRPCRFGTEQYWHGILNHDGSTNRRYEEVKALGQDIKNGKIQIKACEGKKVAMIYDFDSRHAFINQPCSTQFTYSSHFQAYYRALTNIGACIDIIPAKADISEYPVVIVPTMYVLKQEIADKLKEYVENGGMLITTFRTGVKDDYSRIVNEPLPGLIRELCGVEVEEYGVTLNGEVNNIKCLISDMPAEPTPAKAWLDVLRPTTAKVVAEYTGDYAVGTPAVTCNEYGSGKAVYVGTWIDESVISALVKDRLS
ncbi:MAG: beta-galactosidase [Armatimonadota bacterium]